MERFDAARALSLIERYRVTHGNFVPTMFVRMLKLPEAERAAFDLSSLELVVTAAAPISVQVKEQMIDWLGPIMTEFYAGSEGNGFCVIDSPTWLGHKGSVGQPILGQVHICSDDGAELPAGQIGTVWFSGTRRFSYHNDPAKTAGVYNDKGWSTLGDMGYLDAEGYLYLADRRTDLILSGGVNIYPREIEDALALHPAVADIVVFGVPDEEMGQRVHAVVQPAVPGSGTPELAAELIDFCRSRIAHYKAPRAVSFEDELPRLPSGKMLRRLLMDRGGGLQRLNGALDGLDDRVGHALLPDRVGVQRGRRGGRYQWFDPAAGRRQGAQLRLVGAVAGGLGCGQAGDGRAAAALVGQLQPQAPSDEVGVAAAGLPAPGGRARRVRNVRARGIGVAERHV